MANTPLLAVATLAIAYAGYWIFKVIAIRRFYRNVPGPPHTFLLGHAKVLGEYQAKFPAMTSIQSALTQMKHDFDLPDIWYLDLWPFGPQIVICSSPDSAAIPSTINAMDIASDVTAFFDKNLGTGFIEAQNGPTWKELLHIIAPPLTPSATRAYHATIVEEAKIFHDRLQKTALQDEPIDIFHETGKYAFDVVSRVFFGSEVRLRSQTTYCLLYESLLGLGEIVGELVLMLNPVAKRPLIKERDRLVAGMEDEINKIIDSRFAVLQQKGSSLTKDSATTILDRMLLAKVQSNQPVDARLRRLILDNTKGVLAAGFGTTADTIVWLLLLLSHFPEVLAKVREEHTRVFSPSFDETLSLLESDPSRLKQLEYTTAFIYETLRFFPVGPPFREPPASMKSFTYKNVTYPVNGHRFEILTHAIHHDPAVFPSPKEFLPERHLPLSNPPYSRNAYRPFERGPRACLGSTLATEEMRILLVMLARTFDFEHLPVNVPDKPRVSHTDMDVTMGDVAFGVARFTAGPRGPVKMRVRRSKV
ncbi:cytochrome P450 [Cercophora newfieldiana]|uniref:Cytochrome P450 n=1 Tax=Cercophora newfieldiana TaxID=92897 RepID=A0AA40CKV6_9PEZI|nr:cytochrome P450 [Cercophora newfieldiana]